MSLTEEKIIEIVRAVVSGSDRPIGMVKYGILVARAIEAELAKQKAEPDGFVPENKPEVSQAALKAVFKDRPDYFSPVVQQNAEPVLVVHQNEAGQISLKTPTGEAWDMSKFVGAKFYAATVVPADAKFEALKTMLQGVIAHADTFGNKNVATEVISRLIAAAQEEE